MGFPIFGKQVESGTLADGKKDLTISLTPVGRQKAEQFALEGPKFNVVATLLEDGTQSIGELASKTGYSASKVKEICKSLAISGYVKSLKVSQ